MRLGYACVNSKLRERNIFSSHGCTMGTLIKLGPAEGAKLCKSLVVQNLHDLQTTLEWNVLHGIRLFRISSEMLPHCNNHLLPKTFVDSYFGGDIRFAYPQLKSIGAYARANSVRLTFHMTPYVQLGTPNTAILERSIVDTNMYGKLLKALGMHDGVIILHGGGVYQTANETKDEAKQKTLARWIVAFRRLSADARAAVSLECDERHYGVKDLLPFCEKYKIPFCLDVFHNAISADHVPVTPALLKRVMATWPKGHRPKFHLSEQDPKLIFGAHSEYVEVLPAYFFKLKNIDIMVESKGKEVAVLRLYKKYFKLKGGAKVDWIPK